MITVDVHHQHGVQCARRVSQPAWGARPGGAGCGGPQCWPDRFRAKSPVASSAMMPDAAVTSFAVVFTLFAVVTAVLLVLVIRFTLQRASLARAQWLAAQSASEAGGDEDEEEERELTALVLGGGGTRGAVQIGMLQVLTEHGFVPDRIYGSSVGAVNGVVFAGDPTREGVERMTEIWRGLTRDDVYPQGRLHGPWLYFQQRDSVYPNTGLRKVIEAGIDFERLEDALIPVEVVATSLTDGQERWFTYGSAMDAVLASTAVPAIFPPVEIDGERFIDGGVVNNIPIRRAVESGATRIVVLLCGPPSYTPSSPRRPVEAMLNALMISIHARFARDLAQLPPGVDVIVCSGAEGGTRDFDDFSTTESLIAQGREEASEVVRRYGLGVPGALTEAAGPGSISGSNGVPPPPLPAGGDPAGAARIEKLVDGNGSVGDPAVAVAAEAAESLPSTHPEPGT
jgi:NTE family protein